MSDAVALLLIGAAVPVTLVLHLLWQRRSAPHHWYADVRSNAWWRTWRGVAAESL